MLVGENPKGLNRAAGMHVTTRSINVSILY